MAFVRSKLTSRRGLLVAASTATLALGAFALSFLIPSDQDAAPVRIASLTTIPSVQMPQTPAPAPEIWLSALTGPIPSPFASTAYTPEAILPRVSRVLPPLPPRQVAPAASVEPTIIAPPAPRSLPQVAQPTATPGPSLPDIIETAQEILAETTNVLTLAALRAPRRSVFPSARPLALVPPVQPTDALTAPVTNDEPILALARSRLPLRRPAAVARLASLPVDVAPTAPIVTARRSEPLAVPPLSRAIASRADRCQSSLTRAIPRRSGRSGVGSAVIAQLDGQRGGSRDTAVVQEVLSGNIPNFLRDLVPVTFTGEGANGQQTRVTICVMPDYLAVGSDRDFVRVPLGLPAATRIAERFDMVLPTTRMVDAIYTQASVRLSPSPMQPGAQMESTNYFMRHNATVEQQRAQSGGRLGQLVSGHKKDLVLSNRLNRNPGRVAIYGWHRQNGRAIQPLSTVHGAQYADYSHGVRLISRQAYVNGRRVDLRDLLADSSLAAMVSSEGTISNRQLLAALR